mmetsp:Transcript_125775/g.355649  ORF Transcript_125775/g.355649 Transcript_125775/m.355649 type:complete len:328 (-) Transcript_125775:435-1418(-)
MARAAGADQCREAPQPQEAMGVLHAHPDPHVQLVQVVCHIHDVDEAHRLHDAGGAGQQPRRAGPVDRHSQHDSDLDLQLHPGDRPGGLPLEPLRVARDRGHQHPSLHRGVLRPHRRVRPGWDIAHQLRDIAHELLRPDRGAAVLHRGGAELCRLLGHPGPAGLPRGPGGADGPYLQARSLRFGHATGWRGIAGFLPRDLGPAVPPLHGRGALLERPLPRREAELPGPGADDGGRVARVQRRLHLPFWSVAEVRPLLHGGRRGRGLPEHRRGDLVVLGHHDLGGLRRGVPEDAVREVRRRGRDAHRHVAHSLARRHRGPELPGRLRVA